MNDAPDRLNKFLATRLGISRREADTLTEQGKVTINGTVAELGSRVTGSDAVIVNGTPVPAETPHRYVLFNKPVGYVCSRKAQGENPTIYKLLPADMQPLKPVGRLDKDSSGLLLLTSDGDFAHRMTHPSFQKVKIYEVELSQALEPLHQQMISDYGVEIGDGTSKFSLERASDDRTLWIVTMHEGRNRQIRRTFAALGYEVIALNRTQFGEFNLQALGRSVYREITT